MQNKIARLLAKPMKLLVIKKIRILQLKSYIKIP